MRTWVLGARPPPAPHRPRGARPGNGKPRGAGVGARGAWPARRGGGLARRREPRHHLKPLTTQARGGARSGRGQGSWDPGHQGHARTSSGSTRPRLPLPERPSRGPGGPRRRDQRGQDAGGGPPGLEVSPALSRRGRPRREGPAKSRTPGSLLLQRDPLLLLRPCSAPRSPRPLRTTPGVSEAAAPSTPARSPPRGPLSVQARGPGPAGSWSGRSLGGSARAGTQGRSGGRSGGRGRSGRGRAGASSPQATRRRGGSWAPAGSRVVTRGA